VANCEGWQHEIYPGLGEEDFRLFKKWSIKKFSTIKIASYLIGSVYKLQSHGFSKQPVNSCFATSFPPQSSLSLQSQLFFYGIFFALFSITNSRIKFWSLASLRLPLCFLQM